mmetsp:Transcript_5755/g.9854  ORF Transcript_5755/g.9854 Transcript_5755/m.9854 type:complete len:137 (-) Transcript_5755:41-451(-)
MALTGDNFCASAMGAFVLALKNSATFFITNGIGTLIFFLGKMSICIANTFIGYLIITKVPQFVEDIDNPVPVLAIIFLISLMMANVFMEIYSSVSLSMLQCFYADVDICNQNHEDSLNSRSRPEEMHNVVAMIVRK